MIEACEDKDPIFTNFHDEVPPHIPPSIWPLHRFSALLRPDTERVHHLQLLREKRDFILWRYHPMKVRWRLTRERGISFGRQDSEGVNQLNGT